MNAESLVPPRMSAEREKNDRGFLFWDIAFNVVDVGHLHLSLKFLDAPAGAHSRFFFAFVLRCFCARRIPSSNVKSIMPTFDRDNFSSPLP